MKGYEERKAELLDAAWRLFSEHGYDGTTVKAIIDQLEVSKGTFYHYFASKEEVLDAVVERITREILAEIEKVAEDKELSALDKLNLFMVASLSWKLANIDLLMEVTRALYREENLLIRHKMHSRVLDLTSPRLAEIIAQGVEEGVFNVARPLDTAEVILHLGNILGEMNARLLLEMEDNMDNLALIQGRVNLYLEALERILGAARGSIKPMGKEFFQTMAKVLAGGSE